MSGKCTTEISFGFGHWCWWPSCSHQRSQRSIMRSHFFRHNTNRSAIACCVAVDACVFAPATPATKTLLCTHSFHSATMDFMQTQHNPAKLFLATTVASEVRSMPNGKWYRRNACEGRQWRASVCWLIIPRQNHIDVICWRCRLPCYVLLILLIGTDKSHPIVDWPEPKQKKTPTTISAESEISNEAQPKWNRYRYASDRVDVHRAQRNQYKCLHDKCGAFVVCRSVSLLPLWLGQKVHQQKRTLELVCQFGGRCWST